MLPSIEVQVIQGDALHKGSDLFLAKYAQERYGIDGLLLSYRSGCSGMIQLSDTLS